jgi:hypothetical protein
MKTDKYQIPHSSRDVIERMDLYTFIVCYKAQIVSHIVLCDIRYRDAVNLFA